MRSNVRKYERNFSINWEGRFQIQSQTKNGAWNVTHLNFYFNLKYYNTPTLQMHFFLTQSFFPKEDFDREGFNEAPLK